MFLGDRLPIVQRMILADTPDEDAAASSNCGARSKETDFVGILEAMDGLPVTVRPARPAAARIPPPDHEELIVKEARRASSPRPSASSSTQPEFWRESNPMLGTRGVRLGILKPGLYRMQVRALMQAAVTRQGRRATRSSRS